MAEIEGLVRALRKGRVAAKTDAAWALHNLARPQRDNGANRIAIAEAGGIPPLVDLLRDGRVEAKEEAARALGTLAHNDDANKVAIAEAGAIPQFVEVLSGWSQQIWAHERLANAKEEAARALRNLARNNDANKVAIAEAGGVRPLVDLLRNGWQGRSRRYPMEVLHFLARNNDANTVAIAEAGGVPPLVDLLRDGSNGTDTKWQAADTLHRLAANNDANAVAIALAVGSLKVLVELARRGRVTVNERRIVRNAGVPAKRKAALVVAALLRACVPVEVRGQADVRDVIRDVIGPYL